MKFLKLIWLTIVSLFEGKAKILEYEQQAAIEVNAKLGKKLRGNGVVVYHHRPSTAENPSIPYYSAGVDPYVQTAESQIEWNTTDKDGRLLLKGDIIKKRINNKRVRAVIINPLPDKMARLMPVDVVTNIGNGAGMGIDIPVTKLAKWRFHSRLSK